MRGRLNKDLGQIGLETLVSMATDSSLRVIMGKCCENYSAFIFDLIFFILAGNEDIYKILDEFKIRPYRAKDCGVSCENMHESLDELKFRPDTTTSSRVICPCASVKLMCNVVSTLAPTFSIGSSSL